jgi:hypothetical protein
MMIGILLAAVALLGIGAALGWVVLVSLGIRREENSRTLTLATPDKIARGARVTMGVHARRPALIHQTAAYYRNDPRPLQDLEWSLPSQEPRSLQDQEWS